ncbi:MAG: DUF2079 domain-containing protein [Patescibacteria group bacterium]
MFSYFKNLNWQKLNKLLLIMLAVYIVLAFGLCLFKYFTFSYNGLDLAIFNQVFFNSSQSHFFQFTIHPTSYLGDHFEILIFFLIPFYSLFKSPLNLLFIQTLFLAFTVIPLYLIAKKYLNPWQTLLIVILYLFNPVTLNINTFEFHMLALAPFFIAWTFYFYDQNKFSSFLGLALLTLLVREDLAFVIFMFGIIAILDRKKLKWILTPLFVSTAYFFLALKATAYFSSSQDYKFLIYYNWLGANLQEIFINFFVKLPLVLSHLLTLTNFEFVLGFFMVFLFIPLYRPKYLLLSLGMFMQLVLGPASGEAILKMHYGAIFLIVFSLAAIFSLKKISARQKSILIWQKYKDVIALIVIISLIYLFFVLGPVLAFSQAIFATDYQQITLKNKFLKEIPANVSAATSFDLISNLSSRPKLYSLNYLFLGKQQYLVKDFPTPADLQYVLINFTDLASYQTLYEKNLPGIFYQGDDNLRKLLSPDFQLIKIEQNLALWEKNAPDTGIALYKIYDKEIPAITKPADLNLNEQINFLGFDTSDNLTSLYFKPLTKIYKNYFIQLDKELYPLGYGLYPTSEWQIGQIIQLNFYNLPKIKTAQILNLSGGLELDGLNSNQVVWDKKEIIGQFELN